MQDLPAACEHAIAYLIVVEMSHPALVPQYTASVPPHGFSLALSCLASVSRTLQAAEAWEMATSEMAACIQLKHSNLLLVLRRVLVPATLRGLEELSDNWLSGVQDAWVDGALQEKQLASAPQRLLSMGT